MSLTDVHCRLALAVIFFAVALGVWGLIVFLRGGGVSSNYFSAIVIGEGLVLVQGVVGMILVFTGKWPLDGLHFLYGVVIAISWIGAFLYTHGETRRREMGIYALISFFIFGLAIRAIMTGAASAECLPF